MGILLKLDLLKRGLVILLAYDGKKDLVYFRYHDHVNSQGVCTTVGPLGICRFLILSEVFRGVLDCGGAGGPTIKVPAGGGLGGPDTLGHLSQ